MDDENRTAVKLMIAALEAFQKARTKMSGLAWAQLMGAVDKSYYPLLLFDDIDKLTAQMLVAAERPDRAG